MTEKDIFALYKEALIKISRVGYGIELSEPEELQLQYWADLAISYRTLAREVLQKTDLSETP